MDIRGATGEEINKFEAEWVKRHKLMTFDEGEEQLHLQLD